MAKRGVKPREITQEMVETFSDRENPLLEWDDLFDLFKILEEKGATNGVLKAIDSLIQRKANFPILAVREVVDELTIDISDSFGPIKGISVIKLLKSLGSTGYKIPTIEQMDLDDLTIARLSKVAGAQTKAIGKALQKLSKLPAIPEQIKAISLLNEINAKLNGRNPTPVPLNIFENLRNSIAVDKESPIEFVVKHLSVLGNYLFDKKTLHLNRSSKPIKFPQNISREEIHIVELQTFEKILRNGKFDLSLDTARRKTFIRNAFYFQILDFIKTLPVNEFIEKSTPPTVKARLKKPINVKDKNGRTLKDVVDVTVYEPQQKIKVKNPKFKEKKKK